VAEQDGLDVVEDGAVLRITLNRAAAGNAISHSVMAGLLGALDTAPRSNEIRMVALMARGRNFCTGWTSRGPTPRPMGQRHAPGQVIRSGTST
jgi:2-(1,2-epoxy-1,2-dihydrophenyl)acetyl-CoA isomerase